MQNRNFKVPTLRVMLILGIIFIVAAVFSVFAVLRFPAKKYVRSALYAVCHENYSNYALITNTSEEETEEAVDADLQYQAEAFAAYFGIENLSDNSIKMLKEFSGKVFSYSKFKVRGQRRSKDGYTVTVKIKPVLFYEIAVDKVNDYIEEFNQRAEDGEFLYDSDALYEEKFLEGLLKIYEGELDSVKYGKTVKVKVNVKEVANRRYSADITEVLGKLTAFE